MDSLITRYPASARARICVLVKRILNKQGYPPGLSDAALQTVMEQAGALPEPPPVSWADNLNNNQYKDVSLI